MDAGSAFLSAVCGYETAALLHRALRPQSRALPPITALVRPLPLPAKAAVVGGFVFWLVPHLGPWDDRR